MFTSQTLSMLTRWVEDPNGDGFKKHLARTPDYLWLSEDGMTMQVWPLPLYLLAGSRFSAQNDV